MKRGENYILGIDLETGGFEPGRHSILAIGAYWRCTESYGGEVGRAGARPYQHELRLLVEREPDTVVERAAAAKCGWESDEQWLALGAVRLVDALELFIEWMTMLGEEIGREVGRAGAHPCQVSRFEPLAHNHSGVDRPFLEYWSARYDLREVIFGEDGLLSHAWHDSMLTLRAAQVAGLVPAGGGASLDVMLHAMGRVRKAEMLKAGKLKSESVHDAAEDARACFDGYHWLTVLMAQGRRSA